MKTAFYKEILKVVKEAGYQLARPTNGHDIYKKPGCAQLVIPRKLDDPKIYHRILKQAGATL